MTSKKKYKNTSRDIGNANNDLTMILKQADDITLDDLEFDKLFKEQKTILCNIRNILKKTNNMNDNNQSTCDTKTKIDDFRTTYNQLKNKYSLTGEINKMNMKTKINEIKNKISSGKTKSRTRTKKNIYTLGKNKRTTTINSGHGSRSGCKNRQNRHKNRSKSVLLKSSNKLNTRYPVVLVNKSTPTKNLFYVNMDKKKKK